MNDNERSALGDAFDRTIRNLEGLPDVVKTKPTTIRALSNVLNLAQTFIVQTYRHAERGDTIFIEYVGNDGSFRVPLPPEVADTISRQRDALTTKNRRKGAQQAVETRRAKGIVPNFKPRAKR